MRSKEVARMNTKFSFHPEIENRLTYQLFRTMHSLGKQFRQDMEAEGFNRTMGVVLGHLHHQGGMTAADLCRALDVTAASMSKMLRQMERDGLITRAPNPDDARSMLVHLTEKSEAYVEVFPKMLEAIDDLVFDGFSDEERDQFKVFLTRMRQNVEDAEGKKSEDCDRMGRKGDRT